ncbi:hypothetical protein SSS_10303 [Sarcoptes scabiei]|nr:hypothetical protein SSS_10303 [Sarcoptes scabiei]
MDGKEIGSENAITNETIADSERAISDAILIEKTAKELKKSKKIALKKVSIPLFLTILITLIFFYWINPPVSNESESKYSPLNRSQSENKSNVLASIAKPLWPSVSKNFILFYDINEEFNSTNLDRE